jgi:hypothetical protein
MKAAPLIVACLVFFLPAWAQAQQGEAYPSAEIFGGYSYLRTNLNENLPVGQPDFFPAGDANLHGWHASLAGNLNSWFGIAGELSGHYDGQDLDAFGGIDTSFYSFLVGPRLTSRVGERLNPFVHALLGVARGAIDPRGSGDDRSASTFGLALGGGVDLKLGDTFAVRIVQADYLRTHFGESTQNNVRLSIGLVFHWDR